MAAVYRAQRIGGAAVYGDGLSPQYAGTVAGIFTGAGLLSAQGIYSPPAYQGAVTALQCVAAINSASGQYAPPGPWSGASIRRTARDAARQTLKGFNA